MLAAPEVLAGVQRRFCARLRSSIPTLNRSGSPLPANDLQKTLKVRKSAPMHTGVDRMRTQNGRGCALMAMIFVALFGGMTGAISAEPTAQKATSTAAGGATPSAKKIAKPRAHPQTKGPEVSVGPKVPDDYKINMLIRSTIIAVTQANKTGNYSVLRDLGSPNFQSANSVAKLTEIFASQRKALLDLSPVLFFQPKLVQKPFIDSNGMLRVTGFFDTRPLRVTFDLAFELVQGDWRYFGLAVSTRSVGKSRSK